MPARAIASTKYEARKEEILGAAVQVLNHKGVRGMTLALVASQLDLAPRALSYYFRHKEQLAAACFERSINRIDVMLDSAFRAETAADTVTVLCREFFDFRRRAVLGEEEEIAWFEDMRTIHYQPVGEAFTAMFRRIRGVFARHGAPELSRPEQNARTHQLLSQLFWAVLWLPRYNPEDYSRLAVRQAQILLQGLAAEGHSFVPAPLEVSSVDDDPRTISRNAFLRAATQLINENGYLGASVNKISARLNVSKGSFYHHHDAKNDVVEQCFEQTWALIRAVQAAGQGGATDGLTSIASQAARLIEGQISGEAVLLRTSALAAVPEAMRFRMLAGFDRTTFHFASVVSDGIADGSVRPVDVPVAAQMIAGAINAAAELHHWAPGLTPQLAVQHYLRPLFVGVMSGAA